MFKSPGAIAFSIGNLDVHYYGIIMSLSMLIGILTILLIRKKYFKDILTDTVFDISLITIIWGVVGARIYYVLADYKYFIQHPIEIGAIWNGGISIQGAILGALIAGLYYTNKHKLNFLRYADLFVFGLVAGQIAGRWGNFFNSEAFGLPCTLPWKLYIPLSNRPVEYILNEYFHPAFLYESVLNIIVFIILFIMLNSLKNRKDGIIFFLYIILYSIVRILVETIRIDSVLNIGIFHIAHITSFIFIIIALTGVFFIYKKINKDTL